MIEEIARKTVGAAAVELQSKNRDAQGVIDTQREMMKGYQDELIKCAKAGEKLFGKENHFYLCVQTRRERLLFNVMRNQFYARQTRPAPAYDLALYHYDPQDELIRFIWCIPDNQTVDYLILHEDEIPMEERQLVDFCKGFKAGTLV